MLNKRRNIFAKKLHTESKSAVLFELSDFPQCQVPTVIAKLQLKYGET